jgi:hypothetical protein
MQFDLDRVDRIVEILGTMLQRRTIARELESLKHFAVEPEQIDELVLAAINASLCLDDDHLAGEPPRLLLEA